MGKRKILKSLAFVLVLSIFLSQAGVSEASAAVREAKKKYAITLNKSIYTMKKGDTVKLKVKATKAAKKKKILWKVKNKKIAKLSKKQGLSVTVKAKKKGSTTVTAKVKGTSVSVKCKIVVGTPVKSVKAVSTMTLNPGQSKKIGATVKPSNASIKKLKYSVNNKKVIKVSKKGVVSALKVGTAKVTVKATDGTAKKAVVNVKVVNKAAQSQGTSAPQATGAQKLPEYTVSIYYDQENHPEPQQVHKYVKGTKISDIPEPFFPGTYFKGWFYDADFTNAVPENAIVDKDLSLYPRMVQAEVNFNDKPNYVSSMDTEDKNFSFYVTTVDPDKKDDSKSAKGNWTTEDIDGELKLRNQDEGKVIDTKVTDEGKGTFKVEPLDGFVPGVCYQLDLKETDRLFIIYNNKAQDDHVKYHNARIFKKQVVNASLNDDMIYIKKSELKNMGDLSALLQADAQSGKVEEAPKHNGEFEYNGVEEIKEGDLLCIYEKNKPTAKVGDIVSNDPVTYVTVTKVEGNSYFYKTADIEDVLGIPDSIPLDLSEDLDVEDNQITLQESDLNFGTKKESNFTVAGKKLNYEELGLDSTTKVDKGDFLMLVKSDDKHEVSEGSEPEYAEVTGVNTIEQRDGNDFVVIKYKATSMKKMQETGEVSTKQPYEITDEFLKQNEPELKQTAIEQIKKSGVLEKNKNSLILTSLDSKTGEKALKEHNLSLDKTPIFNDEGVLLNKKLLEENNIDTNNIKPFDASGDGGGLKAELKKIKVNPELGTTLKHYKDRKGVYMKLTVGFEIEVSKDDGDDDGGGGDGEKSIKLTIDATAVIEQEVMFDLNFDASIKWAKAWIIPYIDDYRVTVTFALGTYTNLQINVLASVSSEEDYDFKDHDKKTKEALTNLGKQVDKLSDILEEIEYANDDDDDDIDDGNDDGFGEKMDGGAFEEAYSAAVENSDENWLELFKLELGSTHIRLLYGVIDIKVEIALTGSVSGTIAIGMQYTYANAKEFKINIDVFAADASKTVTPIDESGYTFSVYAIGILGFKIGPCMEVAVGILDTDLDSVGVTLEAGVKTMLYMYALFQCGTNIPTRFSGAMYWSLDAYAEIAFVAQVGKGKFSYERKLYEAEWPIVSAGSQYVFREFINPNGYTIQATTDKKFEISSTARMAMAMDMKSGTAKKVAIPAKDFDYEIHMPKVEKEIDNVDKIPDKDGNIPDKIKVDQTPTASVSVDEDKDKVFVTIDACQVPSFKFTVDFIYKGQPGILTSSPIKKTITFDVVNSISCCSIDYEDYGTKVVFPGDQIPEDYRESTRNANLPEIVGYKVNGWDRTVETPGVKYFEWKYDKGGIPIASASLKYTINKTALPRDVMVNYYVENPEDGTYTLEHREIDNSCVSNQKVEIQMPKSSKVAYALGKKFDVYPNGALEDVPAARTLQKIEFESALKQKTYVAANYPQEVEICPSEGDVLNLYYTRQQNIIRFKAVDENETEMASHAVYAYVGKEYELPKLDGLDEGFIYKKMIDEAPKAGPNVYDSTTVRYLVEPKDINYQVNVVLQRNTYNAEQGFSYDTYSLIQAGPRFTKKAGTNIAISDCIPLFDSSVFENYVIENKSEKVFLKKEKDATVDIICKVPNRLTKLTMKDPNNKNRIVYERKNMPYGSIQFVAKDVWNDVVKKPTSYTEFIGQWEDQFGNVYSNTKVDLPLYSLDETLDELILTPKYVGQETDYSVELYVSDGAGSYKLQDTLTAKGRFYEDVDAKLTAPKSITANGHVYRLGETTKLTLNPTTRQKVVKAYYEEDNYEYTFVKVDPVTGKDLNSVSKLYMKGELISTPVGINTAYDGFEFAGWKKKGTDDAPEFFLTASEQNAGTYVTVYNTKDYKITLDRRGGLVKVGDSYVEKNPEFIHKYGLSTTELPDAKKEGYTFVGWRDTKNYSDKPVTSIGPKDITENKTYYADWKADKVAVTFDANGGKFSDGKLSKDGESPYHGPYGYPENITREGYTLSGWALSADSKTVMDDKVMSLTAHTVYAVWEPVAHDIVFHTQYGSLKLGDKTGTEVTKTVKYDQKYGELPTATAEHLTFVGWSEPTDMSKVDSTLTADKIVKTTEREDVYAVWTPFEYKVTLDLDGGTIAEGKNVTTHTYFEEKSLPTSKDITKKGYDFAGWKDEKGNIVGKIAKELTDVSYKAVWTAKKCDAIFYLNLNDDKHTEKFTYNEAYTLPGADKVAQWWGEQKGYTFDGWYTDKNCETKATNIAVGSGVEKAEFYAKWKANTYNISYTGLDGVASNNPSTYTYNPDGKIALNAPESKPHYKFKEWQEIPGNIKVTEILQKSAKDLTFEAIWTKDTDEKYKLTVDMNGGQKSETDSTETFTQDVSYWDGAKIECTPYKEGYTFIGWTSTELGWDTAKNVDAIAKETLTSDAKITAQWEKEVPKSTYKVKFFYKDQYEEDTEYVENTAESYTSAKVNVGSEVELSKIVKTKLGYEIDKVEVFDDVNSGTVSYTEPSASAKVTENGATEIKIYYVHKMYKVIYHNGEDTKEGTTEYHYGDEITNEANDLFGNAKPGYEIGQIYTTAALVSPFIFDIEKMPAGNLDLYIGWNAKTLKITYENWPEGQENKCDKEFNVNLNTFTLEAPEYPGYELVEWQFKNGKTLTGTYLTPSVSEYLGTEDTTITLVWQPINYTLEYALDGGEYESEGNPESYTIETESFKLINPVKANYTFLGWVEDGSDNQTPNNNLTIAKGTTGNKKFIAKWEAGERTKYKITYDYNGGEPVYENPTEYTEGDQTINLIAPTRDAYDFIGWTYGDVTTPEKTINWKSTNTGDVKFTANWKPIDYAIEYDLDGGEFKDGAEYKKTYNVTDTEFIPVTQANEPTKTYYIFDGWSYEGSEAAKTVTLPENTTGRIVLKAKWKGRQYNILYNGLTDGAVNDDENPTSYTFSLTADPIKLKAPKTNKKHCVFLRWTAKDGDNDVDVDSISRSTGHDIELTANWGKDYSEEYDIIFNLDGGQINLPGVADPITDSDSAKYNYANGFYLPTPVKENCAFTGWTCAALGWDNKMTTFIPEECDEIAASSPITFIANWTPASSKYTVHYYSKSESDSDYEGSSSEEYGANAADTVKIGQMLYTGEKANGMKLDKVTYTKYGENTTLEVTDEASLDTIKNTEVTIADGGLTHVYVYYIWEEYNVKFYDGDTVLKQETYHYGETYNNPLELEDTKASPYEFYGYYLDKAMTRKVNTENNEDRVVRGDMNVYMKWVKKYTLDYVTECEPTCGDTSEKITASLHDGIITEFNDSQDMVYIQSPDVNNDPYRLNITNKFIGWKLANSEKVYSKDEQIPVSALIENADEDYKVTVYMVAERTIRGIVNLVLYDGELPDGVPYTIEYVAGKPVSLPTPKERTGSVFTGWKLSPEDTQVFTDTISGDVTKTWSQDEINLFGCWDDGTN